MRSDPATLEPGTLVDNYKIMRLLGRGGGGEVYLARDLRLGRRVALKLLRSSSGEAFDVEARATARLSHPNIVTVHAVGEHQGRPYLALEYVEGETLRARLAAERPGLGEALRIGAALAEALREAHRQDVLHRDLKPENVILGRDGRPRVLDFGLAQLDTVAGAAGGTPAYMAPEQRRGEPSTPATDVFALGLMLHELVLGRLPPVDADGAPPPLARLLARCVAREAAARPALAEIVDTLESLRAPARAAGEAPPFRGLMPFTEGDADSFFGRDGEALAFVERLRDTPVLPIVGLSGAGKSSFVHAGVVPRLQERAAWTVVRLRPGARPFAALARALAAADRRSSGAALATRPEDDDPTEVLDPAAVEARLLQELVADAAALARALRATAEATRTQVLLVVDQLEELHTHVADAGERRAFLAALCGAADDPQDPVRVCFTVRDDFLGRLAEDGASAEVREALGRVTVLGTPGPRELAEILTRPLERAGYRYEDPRMVEEMVAALTGEAAGLPLLQFAAAQLWERRDREARVLPLAAYEAIGGVSGALAAHAESVLAGLSTAEVAVARQALLRLVTPERTRRVVSAEALVAELPPAAGAVVERLVGARLLTARRGDLELAHESLVTRWRRLAGWIDESKEELVFLAELEQAAALWARRGRPADALWQDDSLADARRRAARLAAQLPPLAAEFLAAGAALVARRRRRRRALAVAGAALLAGALIAAVATALVIADKERVARGRLAESMREGARAALGRDEPLEARAKLRSSLESEDSLAARALWRQIALEPLVARRHVAWGVASLAVAAGGRSLVVGDAEGMLHVLDAVTFDDRLLRGAPGRPGVLAALPDGRFAVGTSTGRVAVGDPAASTLTTLDGAHPRGVVALFVVDGQLQSLGADGSLRAEGRVLGELGPVTAAARSSRGALALLDGRNLRVDGGWRVELAAPGRRVAWSDDGARLAVTSEAPAVRVLDGASGAELYALRVPSGAGAGVAFSHDGRRLAAGSGSGTGAIRVWELPPRGEPLLLEAEAADVEELAFSPDDHLLYSGGQTLSVWDLAAGGSKVTAVGHSVGNIMSALSPDETVIATAGVDPHIGLWDAASGRQLGVLRGHTRAPTSVVFSVDGASLYSGSLDGTVRMWDLASGHTRRVLYDHEGPVHRVAVTPDGALLASGGDDRAVRLWRLPRGDAGPVLTGHAAAVRALAAAPGRLASGDDAGAIRVWSLPDGRLERSLEAGGRVVDLAFSPDGRWLAASAAGAPHEVRAFPLAGGPPLVVLHSEEPWGARLAFRADGLLVVGEDRLEVRDLDRGAATVQSFAGGAPETMTATRDGAWLLIGPYFWSMRDMSRRWRSSALLTGNRELLTHEGWARLAPGLPAIDPPRAAWRGAVAAGDVSVDSPDGGTLCVCSQEAATVERWDRAADRAVDRVHVDGDDLCTMVALPGACLILDRLASRLIATPRGEPVVADAQALAPDGAGAVVATSTEVLRLDAQLHIVTRLRGAPGVVALAPAGDEVVIATSAQGVGTAAAGRPPRLYFEDVPLVVTALAAGPRGTAIAGTIDGTLGIWSLETGVRLGYHKLANSIDLLAVSGGQAIALSGRGERLALDLSAFEEPWCQLLDEVWRKVPVVWEKGGARRADPAGHRCYRR